jgi:hypothetical protein
LTARLTPFPRAACGNSAAANNRSKHHGNGRIWQKSHRAGGRILPP